MGQAVSYPPADVVIYMAKYLWFDDIHALTVVSHTINFMIESESDLWRFLLNTATQRIISIPFSLSLHRTEASITKVLIRRTCDHPTSVDKHIFRKHKGLNHVHLDNSHNNTSSCVRITFNLPSSNSRSTDAAALQKMKCSVVANNCFPCLSAAARVPNALVPFTKISAPPVTDPGLSSSDKFNSSRCPLHTASLSAVAYFESSMHAPPTCTSTSDTESDASQSHVEVSKFFIGIAAAPFPIARKVPGEDVYSIGYDSNSGQVWRAGLACSMEGHPYIEGDTVGCGLVYPLTEDQPGVIFFTRNGKLQHKIKVLEQDKHAFFSIAWFPVMVSSLLNLHFKQCHFLTRLSFQSTCNDVVVLL